MQALRIQSHDFKTLAGYYWPAENSPTAIAIILHGLAGHAQRHAQLAKVLSQQGIAIFAFDMRGHGHSANDIDRGYLSRENSWPALVDDIHAVRDFAVQKLLRLPVLLIGHSMGAFLAQAALQSQGHRYAGAVLVSTTKTHRLKTYLGYLLANIESARIDPTGYSRVMDYLTTGRYSHAIKKHLKLKHKTPSWYSSQAQSVDTYASDPLAGFKIRVGTWQCLLSGITQIHSPHARRRIPADLPMLIAAGADDAMGHFGRGTQALANAYKNAGQKNLTTYIYHGSRHALLSDIAAQSFLDDLSQWLTYHQFIGADAAVYDRAQPRR